MSRRAGTVHLLHRRGKEHRVLFPALPSWLGEHRGGTGPCARCSPLLEGCSQSRCALTVVDPRAGLCANVAAAQSFHRDNCGRRTLPPVTAPRGHSPRLSGGRGVSDHHIRRVACQRRGHGGGRSRHAVSASAGRPTGRSRVSNSRRANGYPCLDQRPCGLIVRLATCAVKALRRCTRLAPPALRAADGLDRASREPCVGRYRRPPRKPLTPVSGGATV